MGAVLVIGGGISGLATAYYLTKQGHQVTLFEPADLGGVIKSRTIDGFTLELGPNVLVQTPELANLLAELDLTDALVSPKFANFAQLIVDDQQLFSVPKGPGAFVRSKLLSSRAKIQTICRIFRKLSGAVDDQSVEEFWRQFIGDEAVEKVLDPVLAGIYGGRVSELSARSVFPQIWKHLVGGRRLVSYIFSKREPRRLAVLRGGNDRLVSVLLDRVRANGVKIIQGRAETVTKNSEIYRVTIGSGESFEGTKLFVATSGQATAKYLRLLPVGLTQALNELRYAPLSVLHLSVDSDLVNLRADAFGALFPDSADTTTLGVMFNSFLFPHVSPPGKELFTVCLGGMRNANKDLSDDQIISAARRELSWMFPIADSQVLSIQKWPKAIPQYALQHWRLVSDLRSLEAINPGLHFVGVDLGGAGVGQRVMMALEAVERAA